MFKALKENLSQTWIIAETNLKINLRYKLQYITGILVPIITLILPLIVLNKFFEYNAQFGPWNKNNFMIFAFMAYQINLLRGVAIGFHQNFLQEKYWKTIALYLIAPFKTYTLLFGMVFSRLILISFPFMFFFVLCYIMYPISFYNILFVFLLFFLLLLLFSGMGIILGVFAISKEGLLAISNFFLTWVFWFSCLTLPFQIFPPIFQAIINLNPFYHIFYFIRVAWIHNDALFTIQSNFFQFIIFLIPSLILPIIGVYIFNKMYHKYGIVGY